ncbi:MAG: hypothetical protein R3D99_06520 [Altererythrobacter sp.]
MLRASALWAILTGIVLALMEVRANWGDWQWWPWWLVDFVAAALLIVGGSLTLRRPSDGKPLLTAGWGFTFGMAWMSMAGNVAMGPDPDRDARMAGLYLILVGSLVATSGTGLLLSLLGRPRDQSV